MNSKIHRDQRTEFLFCHFVVLPSNPYHLIKKEKSIPRIKYLDDFFFCVCNLNIDTYYTYIVKYKYILKTCF